MPQILGTPGTAASFDFFTNLITLKRLSPDDFFRVEQFLKSRSVFASGGQAAFLARKDKAELVHEVTHLIDATTSLWGLEYNHRKTLATELLQRGVAYKKEYEQQMRVFMLNTTEIDAHKVFTKQHQTGVALSDCTMHHRVVKDSVYGPLIIVEYHQKGKLVIEVPLSMLAMLEAHAYANETLSRIFDAEALDNSTERDKVLAEIEKAYIVNMDAPATVEYTMLLQLVNRGFPELELKHRLQLLSAIVRITLNADALQMSTFAQNIEFSFLPSEGAESAIWDMLRGASRAVFAFKSILFLDGMVSSLDSQEQAQVTSDFAADCFGTVQRLLMSNGLLVKPLMPDLEVSVSLEPIEQRGYLHDRIIIPASVRQNRSLVERSTCAEAFSQLWLPDAVDLLGKTRLRFPNRIDATVIKVPPKQSIPFTRLWKHIDAQPRARFFI